MKNKIIYGIFGYLIITIIVLIFRSTYPGFFKEEIKNFKENKDLMDRIGGYRTYEYSYNKNDLKTDTLKFKILIIGKNGEIICNGIAVKNSQNRWQIIKRNQSVNITTDSI